MNGLARRADGLTEVCVIRTATSACRPGEDSPLVSVMFREYGLYWTDDVHHSWRGKVRQ